MTRTFDDNVFLFFSLFSRNAYRFRVKHIPSGGIIVNKQSSWMAFNRLYRKSISFTRISIDSLRRHYIWRCAIAYKCIWKSFKIRYKSHFYWICETCKINNGLSIHSGGGPKCVRVNSKHVPSVPIKFCARQSGGEELSIHSFCHLVMSSNLCCIGIHAPKSTMSLSQQLFLFFLACDNSMVLE